MAFDSEIGLAADGELVLPRAARLRSFTALMALYESNYVRLGWLVPCLASLGPQQQSVVEGDFPLHLAVQEVCRYTTTLHLTYFFEEDGARVPDPDLGIRVYHDAKQVEAMECHNRHHHEALAGFSTERGSQLQRRWARNMMLNKWLEYCVNLGHRFGADSQRGANDLRPARRG